MTKRFSDSEIWNKDWFLGLNVKQKLLVKYIFDNCDCAGVYEISYFQLKNIFGEDITKQDFLAIKQVKFISENKIFIEDFIEFQYGVKIDNLNEKYSVHRGILKKLNKINYFETLTKPLANSSLEELQDKDKDKDKDIVSNQLSKEEKEKNKKEKEEIIDSLFDCNTHSAVPSAPAPHSAVPSAPALPSDLLFDKKIAEVFKLYRNHCKNLTPLKFEPRDLALRRDIEEFLCSIEQDFSYLEEVFKKANELKFIVERKIDLKAIIKNHTRIYSGFYLNNTSNKTDINVFLEDDL